MNDKSKKLKPNLNENKGKALLLSMFFYGLSLILPAIGEYPSKFINHTEHIEYSIGWLLMLQGLGLGLLSASFGNFGALAAYANIFYFLAFRMLLKDSRRSISHAILILSIFTMLFLASLSFFYRYSAAAENDWFALGDRVDLWGFGAFFWFFSLGIVASLSFVKDRVPSLRTYLSVFLFCISLVMGYQFYQYQFVANGLERQSYFSKSIILTTKKLSHIPYVKPQDTIEVTKDTVIKIDDSNEVNNFRIVKKSSSSSNFYTPKKFQYKGYFWQVVNFCKEHYCSATQVAELSAEKPVDFHLSIQIPESDSNKAIFKISDKNQISLWDTYAILQNNHQYFPNYNDDLHELFAPLSTTHRKFNIDDAQLKNQIFQQKNSSDCQFQLYENMDNTIVINNKVFNFSRNISIKDYQVWCSKDFMILANNEIKFNEFNNLLIFQNKPTKPLIAMEWLKNDLSMKLTENFLKQHKLVDKSILKQNEYLKELYKTIKIEKFYFGYIGENAWRQTVIINNNESQLDKKRVAVIAKTEIGLFPFDF